MPVTGTTFARNTTILILTALVALLAIVVTSLWLGQRTEAFFDEIIAARNARVATVELRNLLQGMETSQQGFLLTGDEQYLEPYEQARRQIGPAHGRMRDALQPFPDLLEQTEDLQAAIDRKAAEMAETIELARSGRRAEAIAIVATDSSRELMDRTRTLLDDTIAAADRRLTEGAEIHRANTVWQRWTTIAGALVIAVVIGGSVWVAVSYTRELIRARGEVQTLAAGLEERIRERTVDLRRANDEIQRFAYIVTHDLRAPLVNIMGFTAELEEGLAAVKAAAERNVPADDDPVEIEARRAALEDMPEALSFIRSSTQKMDGLINAILKLSREGRRPLKPETIDLEKLLEQSAAAVQHQVSEADGEVTFDVAARMIVSDRVALGQMVGNLLDNAIKYRDTHKPLAIALRTRSAPGRRIVIDVEDNGRGVKPEDHERIFELFRRSGAQNQPGEGIGLSHVRGMARAMGGDVTVRSALGEGATFTIILPGDLRPMLQSAGETAKENA